MSMLTILSECGWDRNFKRNGRLFSFSVGLKVLPLLPFYVFYFNITMDLSNGCNKLN